MSLTVDQFLKNATQWRDEMTLLRKILRECKLDEQIKWGKPCYTNGGNNIAIIQPFKVSLAMMFFKGTLLEDTQKTLMPVGPNSQFGRRFEFRSTAEIGTYRATIKAYVEEAITIENSGKKVKVKKNPGSLPVELKDVFKKRPKLKAAFKALTPGRQRAYLLHFCGAKQAATRVARIEKCAPDILAGKGINDR